MADALLDAVGRCEETLAVAALTRENVIEASSTGHADLFVTTLRATTPI